MFITPTPTMETGILEIFQNKHQIVRTPQPVPTVSYFVTDYPRNPQNGKGTFIGFAFNSFGSLEKRFLTSNQLNTMALAREFFGTSKRLGDFEQEVLDDTFIRSLKSAPTRKNRL